MATPKAPIGTHRDPERSLWSPRRPQNGSLEPMETPKGPFGTHGDPKSPFGAHGDPTRSLRNPWIPQKVNFQSSITLPCTLINIKILLRAAFILCKVLRVSLRSRSCIGANYHFIEVVGFILKQVLNEQALKVKLCAKVICISHSPVPFVFKNRQFPSVKRGI